jgi:hypothetical protein
MCDELITKITPEELRVCLVEPAAQSLDDFVQKYSRTDFLVSHGPIKKDDPLQTQKIALPFATSSGGGMRDLVLDVHPLDSLVYELSWNKIAWHAIPMSKLWVGRASNCGIQIVHSNVSKLHGYFKLVSGQAVYADAGSTNGSKVNNKRIQSNTETNVQSRMPVNVGGVKFTLYSAVDFYEKVLDKLK